MNLNENQITAIKEYASALLPADEIGILLSFSPEERIELEEVIKNHTSSPVYMAYHAGRLQTKYELRKMVIKLARNGSPAAQPLAEKYLEKL